MNTDVNLTPNDLANGGYIDIRRRVFDLPIHTMSPISICQDMEATILVPLGWSDIQKGELRSKMFCCEIVRIEYRNVHNEHGTTYTFSGIISDLSDTSVSLLDVNIAISE